MMSEEDIEPHFRKIEYPMMTDLENTFMQIEDGNFDDGFIKETYGVSLATVDRLVKSNTK